MGRPKLLALLLVGMVAGLVALGACSSGTSPSPAGNSTPVPGSNSFVATNPAGDTGALQEARAVSGQSASFSSVAQGAFSSGIVTPQTGIHVTGQGRVVAAPDLAVLTLGVEARRDSVAAARADAAQAMQSVMDALKEKGLTDADLQTRYFNIQPQYTSRRVRQCPSEPMTAPKPLPGAEERPVPEASVMIEECVEHYEQVIVGYTVNNQLTAKIRDLESVGEIIDSVAAAAGDLVRIQGISFTVEDPSALQELARTRAVENLVSKANQMADAANVELGSLVFLGESGGVVPVPRPVQEAARFSLDASAVTPISGGELEVTITVQGIYNIGQ